jgi:NAD(P)-dependent dehydrogenase (short-subunit alcohol dehydrogenase family)
VKETQLDITGHAAIVTGGASGLGAATARSLASAGAKVALWDLDEAAGGQLANEVGGIFQRVDVTCDEQIGAAIEAAASAHGVARVLVNCAGIATVGKTVADDYTALPFENIRRNVEVNLLGTLSTLAKFAARLARLPLLGEERGVIINTASIAAYDGQRGQVAYSASKAGVVGLTLPAARDLAPYAIRVMTIAPGMFRTNMVGMLTEEGKEILGRQVPFPNRLGHAEEFAQLVMNIIANSMLNGSVIRLDGAHRLGA